jgi:hypothetical protein
VSRDASIRLQFEDGEEYEFALRWGELIKLQEDRDAGPWVVLNRLASGEWFVQDVACVIRLGFIGGGMPWPDAIKKVKAYVESSPPAPYVVMAQQILGAALVGASDEQIKKAEAASQERESQNSQTESSGLPPSSEAAA